MWLSYLRIYPDAINSFLDKCEKAMNEAAVVLCDLGEEVDSTALVEEMCNSAKSRMEENFDVNDITNSILSAYGNALTSILNEKPAFVNLGISFDTYINSSDSHIYVERYGSHSRSSYGYKDGEIRDAVEEGLVEEVASIVCNEYDNVKKRDDVEEFLGTLFYDDLYECVKEGSLSEKVKEDLNMMSDELFYTHLSKDMQIQELE